MMPFNGLCRYNSPLSILGLLIFLFLCGCGSEPGTDLGDWTLTTGDLLLEKELQVSKTKSYFFGSIQDLDVTTETLASIPADRVPVPDAERDSVLAEIPARIRGPIKAALPETKPAFTDLVVADDGRLWIERPPPKSEADTTTWWILTPETKTIQEVRLPSEVRIEVVKNERAYGTTTTENGAPAVMRYRIQTRS